jgi:hypothetical protein
MYTIYDPATGQILSVLSTHDPLQAEANLTDCSYILGDYNSQHYYINQGQAVAKSADPSNDMIQYIFDYATKTWIVDTLQTIRCARQYRSKLLATIDRINPVWHNSLTTEQQTDLVAYRQQLLDVPQQTGFPTSIEWPAKPAWL